MLLDCYIVNEEGEDIKVEDSEMKFTHSTLAIIVSHTTRYVYIFKGTKVSIVQKFASARRASALRLQHGYKIKHIEEIDGIDEDFKPIMEHLGGMVEDDDAEPAIKAEPVKETPKPEKKPEPPKETPPKAAPPKAEPVKEKPKPETKPAETTTKETKPKAKPKKSTRKPSLSKITKTMKSLEPPPDSSCDYLVSGSKLYILLGDNKKDLRKGEFRLEEISTLPEGVFPAENYSPRILIANQRVIGVELWKSKK